MADGLLEISATSVGARLFAADTERISIEGALNGDILPFAGFLRYQNAVFFFLSEETDAQVYVDEVAIPGLVTASLPGILRVAIPDGLGGYDVFDAGFGPPALASSDIAVNAVSAVTQGVIGLAGMSGLIGVALAAWRSKTDAIGPPSAIIYNGVPPPIFSTDGSTIVITLPSMVSGQDGWVYCGTRWGDQSGAIQVVRRIYTQPRGTFTAANGDVTLTGSGTLWTQDLRPRDIVEIDGGSYTIQFIDSDTQARLLTNFTGTGGSGKVMEITEACGSWFDSSLGELVSQDIVKPPRAAGVLQYAGRVFLWGIPDTTDPNPTEATGNLILATADGNPEHVTIALAIPTASGSDLVNVLPGDGVMYLMTTSSLEVVSFTSNPDVPYIIRVAAEPGFAAGTNGIVYKNRFYGFTNRPLRTLPNGDIDVEFAAPVWEIMRGWNPARVVLAIDTENEAVLYIQDDGEATTVVPFMTQQETWNSDMNFSARILDAQVVNGVTYVTYLDSDTRVNQWEGGDDIGGSPFIASQYYDSNFLNRNRLKRLLVTGKAVSISVYVVTPGEPVPDVSDLGQAAKTFTLSNIDSTEPEIFTNLQGRAFAYRVNFGVGGTLDKIIARGVPVMSENR